MSIFWIKKQGIDLRRIFLNNLDNHNEWYELGPENREFHHLKNVLRGRIGDSFEVFNGKGLTGVGTVKNINRNRIKLNVTDFKEVSESRSKIDIAVSIVKTHNFSVILNSMMQLGVNRIYPVISEYSYIKKFSENKIEKWNNILIDAAKQCRNNYLTFIDKVYTIDEILSFDYSCKILFNSKYGKNIKNIEESICNSENILVVIGPEGGFSESELEKFQENEFFNIKLETNILRTETGATVTVGVLKYITEEM